MQNGIRGKAERLAVCIRNYDRETEVHLLKVLLGDIQGFGSVDGVRLKTIIDGVDGILEVLTLFKA